MTAMPDGGLMIVFSLYDRNIELVAKGLGEDVLRGEIRTVARRTGAHDQLSSGGEGPAAVFPANARRKQCKLRHQRN